MAMVQNFVIYSVRSLLLKLLARNTNTVLNRYALFLEFLVAFFLVEKNGFF